MYFTLLTCNCVCHAVVTSDEIITFVLHNASIYWPSLRYVYSCVCILNVLIMQLNYFVLLCSFSKAYSHSK